MNLPRLLFFFLSAHCVFFPAFLDIYDCVLLILFICLFVHSFIHFFNFGNLFAAIHCGLGKRYVPPEGAFICFCRIPGGIVGSLGTLWVVHFWLQPLWFRLFREGIFLSVQCRKKIFLADSTVGPVLGAVYLPLV